VRPTRPFVAVVVAAGLLLCAPGNSLPAEAPACECEEVVERTFLDNIKASGYGGYTIIILAVGGVAAALALAVEGRRASLLPPLLVSQLEQALNSGDVDRARELCVKPTHLRNVLFAGLARLDAGREAAARAVHLAAEKERTGLRRNAGWLLLLAVMAVLIGALSAVSSFIEAFNKAAMLQGSILYRDWTDPCINALRSCIMGLFVAVVLVPAWWLFRERAEVLAHEIEATVDDLISRVGTDVAGDEEAKA